MRSFTFSRSSHSVIAISAIVGLIMAACGQAAPTPTPAGKAAPAPAATAAEQAQAAKPDAKATNPKLAAMIQKAAEEKEIIYQAPDAGVPGLTTADMLRDMSAVTKKHFGVDIKITLDGALSFPASTSKALTEIKAGSAPSYDLMYQTSISGSPLYAQNAVEDIAWLELFPYLSDKDLQWKGKAIVLHTQFGQPIFNSKLVKAEDVPTKWDDLLDQKWRGKIGALIYTDPWVILAQPDGWGKDKTVDYVKKLSALNPKLGRFPEVHERVLSGETPMGWVDFIERAVAGKEAGIPIDFAAKVEPALIWVNILFVPKGAKHANAAGLVAAAMLTEEGQKVQEKYIPATSMYRPGTQAFKFAQERKTLLPDVDWQIQYGNDMRKEFEDLLVKK